MSAFVWNILARLCGSWIFFFYLRALVLGCRGEEFRGRNRCITPLVSIVFAALI